MALAATHGAQADVVEKHLRVLKANVEAAKETAAQQENAVKTALFERYLIAFADDNLPFFGTDRDGNIAMPQRRSRRQRAL